jgi:uncharacterized DUF497 family protein
MLSIFEWDDAKNRSNRLKHGVDFAEAVTALADPHSLLMRDPDHSGLEERFIVIGMSSQSRILVVCHCYRREDSAIRIFSARKTTRAERFRYEEMLP